MKNWICFMVAICLAAALTGCGRQGHGSSAECPAQTTDTVATGETEATPTDHTGEAELDFSDFE